MISRNIKLTRLRPHSDYGALRKDRLEWWLNNTPNVHHPVLHEVTLNPVRSMSINNLRIVNNWLIGDIFR